VRWLSEILYQLDGRGFVPRRVSVQRVDETGLSATLRGEQLDLARHSTRTDVKAITYHQLSVQESRQGVVLRVFVDI
jgi:SHS2 domain-containing protein